MEITDDYGKTCHIIRGQYTSVKLSKRGWLSRFFYHNDSFFKIETQTFYRIGKSGWFAYGPYNELYFKTIENAKKAEEQIKKCVKLKLVQLRY